jgi:demethylmenaquinone methyltransferase/2-methoxy-6-polyprenyl-1,4-benzoquinol methylase
VEFRTVDAYTLAELGDETFDAAFAGCWWSHVPLQRLPAWLDTLHARLEPGARVVMLDNSFVQTSSTPITHSDAQGNTYQMRTLDDGSTHEVLKNFPTPGQAAAGARARDL